MRETILGIRAGVFMLLSFSTYYIINLITSRYLTVDNLFNIFMITSLASALASRLLEEAVFRALKKALANTKD